MKLRLMIPGLGRSGGTSSGLALWLSRRQVCGALRRAAQPVKLRQARRIQVGLAADNLSTVPKLASAWPLRQAKRSALEFGYDAFVRAFILFLVVPAMCPAEDGVT